MAKYDSISINVETKTTEQNLSVIKGYINELANQLNYDIDRLEDVIASLESRVSALEGKE